MSTPIYFVDLDGTLIAEDSGFETFKLFVKTQRIGLLSPRFLYLCLASPFIGRARIKQYLAQRVTLDLNRFHYNTHFISWLRQQKMSQGLQLILTTGTDQNIAMAFAERLQLFDGIIASNGVKNRVADEKRQAIEEYLRGRDEKSCYVGNSSADLKVWPAVDYVICVNLSVGLQSETKRFQAKKITEEFEKSFLTERL